MDNLSRAQQRVFSAVCEYYEANGYPPTVREICGSIGISSTATVQAHLVTLENKGYIIKDPNHNRAYTITEEALPKRRGSVPLLGRVAAGIPIMADENIEESFMLPEQLVHRAELSETFMLRVQGDSMIDAGIMNHDIIIVNTRQQFTEGDIVVARIDGGEVTVKRIYVTETCVKLMPENKNHSPICVEPERVEVVGKVVGLMRRM